MPDWLVPLWFGNVRSTEFAGDILIFAKKLLSFDIEQGLKSPAEENDTVA
ncbi:MAG: hypothetical protein JRE28_09790 [Deltaproteobacteria bacterium]|nr:hypothetical protein [Deltaproteobacteria bacterium]